VHFRYISAKIWPKNVKQHFDWWGGGPPGYAFAQDLKNVP